VQHSRLCDSSSMQEQPPGATQVDAVVSTCAWIGIYTLLHQQSKHVSLGPGRMFLICAGQCYLLAPSSPATFNQMRVPSAGKLDVAPSIYNLNLVFVRSCMVTIVPLHVVLSSTFAALFLSSLILCAHVWSPSYHCMSFCRAHSLLCFYLHSSCAIMYGHHRTIACRSVEHIRCSVCVWCSLMTSRLLGGACVWLV